MQPRSYKPTHLSPSSIGMFLEDPARWVLRYGYGVYGRQSPAMLKGIAVEAGVQAIWWPTLVGKTLEERERFALKVAQNNFMIGVGGAFRDSKDELTYATLEDALYHAVRGVMQVIAPTTFMPLFQQRCEEPYLYAGLKMPVLGYCDFWWPTLGERGVLIDLKVTSRIPSEVSRGHARQVMHYRAALNGPQAMLVYASDKKFSVIEPTEEQLLEGEREIVRTGRVMARLLERYEWRDLVGMFAPNFDSYVWCDESREAAERLWLTL